MKANKTLETNCHFASPLEAGRKFERRKRVGPMFHAFAVSRVKKSFAQTGAAWRESRRRRMNSALRRESRDFVHGPGMQAGALEFWKPEVLTPELQRSELQSRAHGCARALDLSGICGEGGLGRLSLVVSRSI
jgi:hypothetical protein